MSRVCWGRRLAPGFSKKVGKDILRIDAAKVEYVTGGGKADELASRILKDKELVKHMTTPALIDQPASTVPVLHLP